ncbi:MAG: hypothetical protein AAF658_09735 [Myxococcota bacterium]
MIRIVVITISVSLLASLGFAYIDSDAKSSFPEDLVHANLIRVQVNGAWQDFPMVPLSRQLCSSNRRIYTRYCN